MKFNIPAFHLSNSLLTADLADSRSVLQMLWKTELNRIENSGWFGHAPLTYIAQFHTSSLFQGTGLNLSSTLTLVIDTAQLTNEKKTFIVSPRNNG